MATSNEEIRDSLIRRQIRLMQLSEGIQKRLKAQLVRSESALYNDMLKRLRVMSKPRVTFGKTTKLQLRRLRNMVQESLAITHRDIRTALKKELLDLALAESGFVATSISSALPVVVSLDLPTTAVLNDVVLNRPFEGKVLREWMGGLQAGDRTRIMDSVRIGLMRGESADQVVRRIGGTARLAFADGEREITRRGLQGIVQTATNHTSNQARQELYRANKKLIPFEVYTATLDSRTTPICQSLDGQKFKNGEGPVPPVHFNCRSTRVPFINGAQAGTRAADATTEKALEGTRGKERKRRVKKLVGQVPASQNYQQFLKNQNVAFQNEVLGKQKATLFRKGGVSLDRFVNSSGKTLSMKELRRISKTDEKLARAFSRAGLQTQ
jgi:SPP1 gp7 family putative phage head morphogenesis protein